MMKLIYRVLFFTAIFTLAVMPVKAEVITLKTVTSIGDEPPNSEAGIPRPVRGMTMDKVSAQFGAPVSSFSAVGKPPITRWMYEHFTVYFEGQHVINSVVIKK